MNKFNEWINKKKTDITNELFKKHFNFQRPSDMLKLLYTTRDKTKNDELVNAINSGIKDVKEDIEVMSEVEKKKEKAHKILQIV